MRLRRRPIPEKLPAALRQRRYLLRRLGWLALAGAIAGALALVDRAGLFGEPYAGDVKQYHHATFAVTHVVDGDTLDVDCPDRLSGHAHTRIRLWGVDTPETVKPNTPPQHFGKEASDFTKQTCIGQSVRLEVIEGNTRDKYNRLLAYLYLPDGRCLNAVLVAEGYAYADPRYDHPHKDEYVRLQARAKKAKLGLWKDAKPDDLPYYYQPQSRPGSTR
ncbi:MAG: thermonuclease family protein [Planctomycetota bacterium]|nr:thermonuclease family protein [Planctomycetota bacterium]